MGINEEQKKAISELHGPSLIVAGAGSGKSTIIVERVKKLVYEEGINPDKILVIMFNTEAKVDIERRISSYIQEVTLNANSGTYGEKLQGVNVHTFHSLCRSILSRHYNKNIRVIAEAYSKNIDKSSLEYDEEDANGEVKIPGSLHFVGGACKNANLKYDEFSIKFYHEIIKMCRSRLWTPDEYLRRMKEAPFPMYWVENAYRVYLGYLENLKNEASYDFAGLLFECRDLLKQGGSDVAKWFEMYSHILVDEFQDIDYLQYEIVSMLVQKTQNICVVGDDDQCIYTFRGADDSFIRKKFQRDFFKGEYEKRKIKKLSINHRCPANVVISANNLISKNKNRLKKTKEELKVDPGNKVEFRYFKGNIGTAQKSESKYIIEKIKEIHKSNDASGNEACDKNKTSSKEETGSLNKIEPMNVAILCRSNKKAKSIMAAFEKDDGPEGLSEFVVTENEKGKKKNRYDEKNKNFSLSIVITTVHKEKGKEFDVVFMPGLDEGSFPVLPYYDNAEQAWDALENERRLFYVGLTRAKGKLFLSSTGKTSRFIYEISPEKFSDKPGAYDKNNDPVKWVDNPPKLSLLKPKPTDDWLSFYDVPWEEIKFKSYRVIFGKRLLEIVNSLGDKRIKGLFSLLNNMKINNDIGHGYDNMTEELSISKSSLVRMMKQLKKEEVVKDISVGDKKRAYIFDPGIIAKSTKNTDENMVRVRNGFLQGYYPTIDDGDYKKSWWGTFRMWPGKFLSVTKDIISVEMQIFLCILDNVNRNNMIKMTREEISKKIIFPGEKNKKISFETKKLYVYRTIKKTHRYECPI